MNNFLRYRISYYSEPELFYEIYQNNCRFYEDEFKSNEPEIETDNFFYERFLRRK